MSRCKLGDSTRLFFNIALCLVRCITYCRYSYIKACDDGVQLYTLARLYLVPVLEKAITDPSPSEKRHHHKPQNNNEQVKQTTPHPRTHTHRNTKIPSYRPTGFHVNSGLPSQGLLFPARSLLAAARAGMCQRMADPDAGLPACLALHLRACPPLFSFFALPRVSLFTFFSASFPFCHYRYVMSC